MSRPIILHLSSANSVLKLPCSNVWSLHTKPSCLELSTCQGPKSFTLLAYQTCFETSMFERVEPPQETKLLRVKHMSRPKILGLGPPCSIRRPAVSKMCVTSTRHLRLCWFLGNFSALFGLGTRHEQIFHERFCEMLKCVTIMSKYVVSSLD